MPENKKRKCCKCASTSRDPGVVLYRFPKPGIRNVPRCEAWARYCFPKGQWSSPDFQKRLYSEHHMLCHKHFKRKYFISFEEKRLHRHGIPDVECDVIVIESTQPVQMDHMIIATQCPSPRMVFDVSNLQSKENKPATENIERRQLFKKVQQRFDKMRKTRNPRMYFT